MSVEMVRSTLNAGKCSDPEIKAFILYAKAVQADPWAREIYIIKYQEGQPASIVLSVQWYLKRAAMNSAFIRYTSGVIVWDGEKYADNQGAMVYPNQTLFGGWAKAYTQWDDEPFDAHVMLRDYDKNQANWKTMPATMIEKVAITQVMRRGFPGQFDRPVPHLPAGMDVILDGETEETKVESDEAMAALPAAGDTVVTLPVHEAVPDASPSSAPPAMNTQGDTALCPIHEGQQMFWSGQFKKWGHVVLDAEGNKTKQKANPQKDQWHNMTQEQFDKSRNAKNPATVEAPEVPTSEQFDISTATDPALDAPCGATVGELVCFRPVGHEGQHYSSTPEGVNLGWNNTSEPVNGDAPATQPSTPEADTVPVVAEVETQASTSIPEEEVAPPANKEQLFEMCMTYYGLVPDGVGLACNMKMEQFVDGTTDYDWAWREVGKYMVTLRQAE